MTCSRLEEQALRSAAHLVAAVADKRFGARGISDEVRDCVAILSGELDELGLLDSYRRPDGTLAAWHPEDDTRGSEVLGRASSKRDKPSEPSDLPAHRIVFPM